MAKTKPLLVIIFLLILLSACNTSGINPEEKGEESPAQVQEELPAAVPVDPRQEASAVKADESGKIMVLMYHVIGASREGDWAQTAANFRRDLETLYEQGYSLLSLTDYLTGNISTPPGRTPVVLTFDDGTEGHFRYLDGDGEGISRKIDPDCAVGILLEFEKGHPGFGHAATFYINDRPFGQQAYWREKLRHLVELGFEIGNHTLTHPKLNKISDEKVQKELAGLAKMVEETVPGYKVTSLALPHGLSPQNKDLAVKGNYEGYAYENMAVLRVGANPALSPVVKEFDPFRLPRVQASTTELYKWLEYFQKKPEERYVSDGNPQVIAVPNSKAELIDHEKIGDKLLITY